MIVVVDIAQVFVHRDVCQVPPSGVLLADLAHVQLIGSTPEASIYHRDRAVATAWIPKVLPVFGHLRVSCHIFQRFGFTD